MPEDDERLLLQRSAAGLMELLGLPELGVAAVRAGITDEFVASAGAASLSLLDYPCTRTPVREAVDSRLPGA
jgi:hypothetical protein